MPHADGVHSRAQDEVAVAATSGCATHVCSESPAKVSELSAFGHQFVSAALASQASLQLFPEPTLGKPLSRGPPGLQRTPFRAMPLYRF
jgi:hypothetical protein